MKKFFLAFSLMLIALVGGSLETSAGQDCEVTIEQAKQFLDKGEKYLPSCLQNKPRIKQKNNFNLKKRGSDIVYYSRSSDDCHQNCMSVFAKCLSAGLVSASGFTVPDDVIVTEGWEAFKARMRVTNIIQSCKSALDSCRNRCPQASRPPPIDSGRVPGDGGDDGGGSGDTISGTSLF